MVDALAHRGPDGSGVHASGQIGLGHRRLSILDPTEAGAQPMRRGGTLLVHNGEIYNFLEFADELRDQGEAIVTGTDTEVILAAYRVWGPDAVQRFNGMFAFALWDDDRRRLLVARDRMGIKPLYLRRTPHTLAFASEPMAFVAAGPLEPGDPWTPRPHPGVVHDFLSRGWTDHSSATFPSRASRRCPRRTSSSSRMGPSRFAASGRHRRWRTTAGRRSAARIGCVTTH